MPAFEWWTNATRDTIQFVTIVRLNTKHKKDENTRIKRKEIWKKVRDIEWVVLNFI